MKSILLLVLWLLLIMISSVQAGSSSDRIPLLYARIDRAVAEANVQEMISILSEMETVEIWSFGAGLGPTDADWLQFLAMRRFEKSLLTEAGSPTGALSALTLKQADESWNAWITRLGVVPSNEEEIVRLLGSGKPAHRLVGLRKAAALRTPGASVVERVWSIATNDTFVVIQRRGRPAVGLGPPKPDDSEADFVCPLREVACDFLNARGLECKPNWDEIGDAGIARLLKLVDVSEQHRDEAAQAIRLLDHSGHGIRAVVRRRDRPNSTPSERFLYDAARLGSPKQ